MLRGLVPMSADPGTLQSLWRRFRDRGDAPAVIAFSGDRSEICSYAELSEVSARIATTVVRRGIGLGEGVALIGPNSARWITAFWGIVAAGAAAVPLDAQTDDRELARMLRVGGCRLAFTTAALGDRIRALAPSCELAFLDSDMPSAVGQPGRTLLAPDGVELPMVTPLDTAVIVFTSGTTGTPKAVPLTHGNLMANVMALAGTNIVGKGDRALLPLPLYHAYPLTIGMITPLALGCAVVLPAGISGPELLTAMRQGEVTALVGVPRLYAALVENMHRVMAGLPRAIAMPVRLLLAIARRAMRRGIRWPGRVFLSPLRRRLAPRLRLLVSGGAAVATEIEETLDAFGWEMLTGYGLVETSSMLTFNPPGAAVAGSAGKPVPGMELRIVNADAGGIGEIETRGPSLFTGYRDDPTKTAEAFTADGWFRTGDLGAVDARGYLHVSARKTETIVLADGKKLFPEDVETAYAAVPLVHEIALLGIDGALVGLVVPDLAAARDMGAMRLGDSLREGLAAQAKALPSYARLSGFAVAHQPLPRTQLGKIRRHLLPAIYAAAQRHEGASTSGPVTPEDQALLETPPTAALWRWLQKRFPDRSLHLDTILQLDLGIDSLAWVDLTLALQRELGITLHEDEIARIITIRDLLRETRAAGPRASAIGDAAAWIDPRSARMRLLRWLGERLVRLIMRAAFRLEVAGAEHLPLEGPLLICPNHASYLDPFAVGMALPRRLLERTYWGGWSGVAFNTRLRRLFSRAAGVIPVDPDRAAGAGLALGRLVLERDNCLVWFPEGSRSADGTLQQFLPGIGALVEGHAVPVVPVFIDGSFAAWPVGRRFPRLRRIEVRFGAPLLPDRVAEGAVGRSFDEKFAAALQAAVAALAAGRSSRG